MKNAFILKDTEINWREAKAENAASSIDEAMALAQKNLETIKNLSQDSANFENCVRAFDRAALELSSAWNLINHVQSVCDSPEMRSALNSQIERVSNFFSSIYLDEKLFEKISAYANSNAAKSLTGAKARLLSEILADFKQSGAHLDAEKKAEIMEIDRLLTQKTQKFSENALDALAAFKLPLYEDTDVSGLPAHALEVARKKAEECKCESPSPRFIITLEGPSYIPFMAYANRDDLREKLFEAHSDMGRLQPFNNTELILEILKLRKRKAEILGYENFADFVVERRMAHSGKNARSFVENMREKIFKAFEKEGEILENFASEKGYSSAGEKISPHSASYITQKLREKKYGFNPEDLRPYLEMSSVMRGMFDIFSKVFSLEISKREKCEAWHQSVEMFDVFDCSESEGENEKKLIGSFYADMFPRKGKRAGAWANILASSDSPARRNVCVIVGNMSEATQDTPALMSFDDVCTLFHEFGHAIHFMMMNSEEAGLRNVAWDFVELPSQIFENWCKDKSCWDIFARHYQTGEKIPQRLYDAFLRSEKFMGASFAMRQLSFSKIDLDLHISPENFYSDLEGEAQKSMEPYLRKYSRRVKTLLPHFSHIFGDSVGYAAGYYSYKWAEVLSADAFSRFKKEGIFNSKTGRDFADKILKPGNEIEAGQAFKNFMGRDPDSSALIEDTIEKKLL